MFFHVAKFCLSDCSETIKLNSSTLIIKKHILAGNSLCIPFEKTFGFLSLNLWTHTKVCPHLDKDPSNVVCQENHKKYGAYSFGDDTGFVQIIANKDVDIDVGVAFFDDDCEIKYVSNSEYEEYKINSDKKGVCFYNGGSGTTTFNVKSKANDCYYSLRDFKPEETKLEGKSESIIEQSDNSYMHYICKNGNSGEKTTVVIENSMKLKDCIESYKMKSKAEFIEHKERILIDPVSILIITVIALTIIVLLLVPLIGLCRGYTYCQFCGFMFPCFSHFSCCIKSPKADTEEISPEVV